MFRTFPSIALLLWATSSWCFAQVPPRVNNTTLQMPPEVFSSVSYDDERIINGGIGFPVALATPPGETNQLFIVDREGTIRVIPDLRQPTPEVFLDISDRVESDFGEEGLLGLTFHPQYASNGYFYVFYTENPGAETFVHFDTLSRFSVSSTNALRADASSEIKLIRQPGDMWARNHNGGDVQFGRDGYLYVSLGDGGNSSRAQRLDGGFYAGIIRIDVDLRPGNPLPNPHLASVGPYAIPDDNPYLGATQYIGSAVNPASIRSEYFATGLRNPWRMTVDPVSGEIIVGDVGEGSYEEVNYVIPRGNYGWPFYEGPAIHDDAVPPTGVQFLPPIHAYDRDGGLSVIGGIIYRGTRLPELQGHYLFTDWANGEIRALLPDGTNVVPVTVLADTGVGFGPSAFGRDPRNGDLLMCDNRSWTQSIRRLIRNPNGTIDALPPTLAGTGAFSDLTNLTPNPGIIPYDINLPFWSDGAIKSRWFSLPDTNLVYGFDAERPWDLPASSVWIKHFDIDMEEGNPGTRRRLETRFIVRTTNNVYGATYRWDSATNATLVAEEGASENLMRTLAGNIVTQRWDYPARGQCLSCHTPNAGHALGFNTVQLNRENTYGSVTTNQLLAMRTQGYITNAIASTVAYTALASLDDDAVSLTRRARSYLQANCASCHDGSGLTRWDARMATPLDQAHILDGPLNDSGGQAGMRVVSPGEPRLSMLLERIQTRGPKQMPPLASHLVDTQAVALVEAWIEAIDGWSDYDSWAVQTFGQFEARADDEDGDQFSNYGEYLLQLNDPTADYWKVPLLVWSNNLPTISFEAPADLAVQLEWKDRLTDTAAWQLLDIPENALRFPAQAEPRQFHDPDANSQRVYRARLIGP